MDSGGDDGGGDGGMGNTSPQSTGNGNKIME